MIGAAVLPPEIEEKDQVLKNGYTFCVLSERGDIQNVRSEGVFHHNCRQLSFYRSRLGQQRLVCLSHRVLPEQTTLVVHLVNQDTPDLARGALHAKRTLHLEQGQFTDRWEWTNLSEQKVEGRLHLELSADFQDIFEVRNWLDPLDRQIERTAPSSDSMILRYQGADDALRRSRVTWTAPLQVNASDTASLQADLSIEPDQVVACEVRFDFFSALQRTKPPRQKWTIPTSVETSNTQLNRWLRQSFRDLRMLVTETSEGPYPFAGTPWFSTVFGRDGLITGLRSLWLWPELSAGILRTLAAHQANHTDVRTAAEPGKILHEMRTSERSLIKDVPFEKYYGAVDSTPLFIILAGAYWSRTGDRELIDHLWPALTEATKWLLLKTDEHQDGFLTYQSQDSGLVHQGWRDADDAVFHRDGRSVSGRVALVEVQAYLYRALQEMARLATQMKRPGLEKICHTRAEALRERFEARFWDEEMQFYAMAIDQDNRPCRVYSSCPGHSLWMGLCTPSRAASVARTLLSPKFWSGWGLRTVAEGEPRYSPLSYHNGSVWPHDTALCAEGLSRYGFRDAAVKIFRGLFHATEEFDLRRLPELFCGFQRSRENGGVVRFPGACSPQAWSAITPFSLLNSMLGLRVQGAPAHISFTSPRLAPEIEWVRVRNLSVGSATLSFEIHNSNGRTTLEVLDQNGDCEVDLLL